MRTSGLADVLRKLYPTDTVQRLVYGMDTSASYAHLQLLMMPGLTYRQRVTLIGQLTSVVRMAKHRKQYDFDVHGWMRNKLHQLRS